MILWLAFGSIFGVWNVFQSSGLDFRLIAVGALLPLAIDAPFGHMSYAHTLLSGVVVLVLAMGLTAGRGKRLRRRRALSLSIGWFAGLVLSGAWAYKEVFWWPAFGTSMPDDAPLFPALPLAIALEIAGAAAAFWVWTRFGLADAERRSEFARTGRLRVEESSR